ncbi:hypothetical protein L21SP5_03838 [Salinivirga cyanobacteriivorans]|uniref:HupE / UreJ protein n=2 Tax=Salinivirga cyanobacteriivorans TaxID=1307839 RepID=A0A0S2I587_9BACT|nr:hypothetical protein L21SP5_03838 [Salinivirga cyanobacteriivorans]
MTKLRVLSMRKFTILQPENKSFNYKMFDTYFILGLEHIANLKGYDHIIFLITLCAVYKIREWKPLLILVTAFTIGHSLTLALATLDYLNVNSTLIEILIPVTILISAIINIIYPTQRKLMPAKYLLALFFGLIHGLGFSNYLSVLLSEENSLVLPLFGFNTGVEAGQILIVASLLLLSFLVLRITSIKLRDWIFLLSGAGIGTSIIMIIDRI